jgi:hypothetical protein
MSYTTYTPTSPSEEVLHLETIGVPPITSIPPSTLGASYMDIETAD